MSFDTKTIKENVDILALVESELGPYHSHHGQWYAWPCPFHSEKTPSFKVNPATRSWRCYGACQKSGNAIEWIGEYKGIGFKDSCRHLERFMRSHPPIAIPRPPMPTSKSKAVTDLWQSKAVSLVKASQPNLWSSVGAGALAYLRQRGLTDETIRNAHLGYNIGHKEARNGWGIPNNGYDDYVWIDNGIIIPSISKGVPQRITIRRFPKVVDASGVDQKYKILSGSDNTLYNGELLDPTRPAILTEGIFDALSVQQAAGDLIVSVATDSTGGARTPEWIDRLAALPLVLVAYDADEAGDTASGFWLDSLLNAKRWRPTLDDPNAMLQAGVNIRSWVQDGLS